MSSRIAKTLVLLALASYTSCFGQMIVAHRGASFDAPENTLAAFRLAWERGADGIEGDFYLTADGQIVCLHDKTTKRVAPDQPELTVAESTLQQLRQVDVGRWKDAKFAGAQIPTLNEVLAIVPLEKRIFVEIKCGPEIVPKLKSQLEASRLNDEQIVIIAFDANVVRACRQAMPQYKCNWLTGYEQEDQSDEWKPGVQDVVATLQKSEATGLGTQGNENVIDRSFIDRVRVAGCQFHVWTINDVDAARRFAALGVDSITTDRPAFIRRELPLTRAVEEEKISRQPFHYAVCEGTYQHHLQGICADDDAIYWSFTTTLAKTDRDGKLLKKVPVANHHGDLCRHDGRIYVAVNLGRFNDPQGNADSWVYVYDAKSLQELARHKTQEVVYGAGGIGFRGGHFFIVGGIAECR